MKELQSLLLAALCCLPHVFWGQISFSNQTQLLNNQQVRSGVAMGACDVNQDGLDDIVRFDLGKNLMIEYQTSGGQKFQSLSLGNVYPDEIWGLCVADIDNNGYPDVLFGGEYDDIFLAKANDKGTGFSVVSLQDVLTFVQTMNLADMNNDGWLDAFICNDNDLNRIYLNDGQGNLVYSPNFIPLATVPFSDNSGNYGSVWSDVNNDGRLDLYIAKCRQNVNSPTDPRRINQLFLQNADGTFSQDITNASGLRIGAQSWTADFGDIDNDGDMDCLVTNHDVSSQLLENDGTGKFTDITAAAGLFNKITGAAIQGIFRDFDNDGFLDILIAGERAFLFKNLGNKTFSAVPNLWENTHFESCAVGDFNQDGFPDIYSGYAILYNQPSSTPDVLWMNDGNDNHFVGVTLRGKVSNKSGVGARIILHTPSGKQIREVRSGESYGIQNSLSVTFGMGKNTQIDSIEVRWPAGKRQIVASPQADQYLLISEDGCVSQTFELSVLGNTTFCEGDSAILQAPPAAQFVWNTGSTTQNIVVQQGGLYQITVTDDTGCTAVSFPVKIVVNPDETPKIDFVGDTMTCFGKTVQLIASPATAYFWSTGDTTRQINCTTSGTYFVEIQGLCEKFSSQKINIQFKNVAPPSVTPATTWVGGRANLQAADGEKYWWYDVSAGGVPIFSGANFITPPLAQTTTFWVSNFDEDERPNEFVGMVNHAGTNFGGQTINGKIIFDCHEAFRLKTVRVYSSLNRVRQIELQDANGNVLASKMVNIPTGTTTVELNFDVPKGENLVLTTNASVNQSQLGTVSPQLRRSDSGVAYPYTIPKVVTLKNSDAGSSFYYYFYNWEVDFVAQDCESERVPVQAIVDPNLVSTRPQFSEVLEVKIAPNPADAQIWVQANIPNPEWKAQIFNELGQSIRQFSAADTQQSSREGFQISVEDLPAGIYFLKLDTPEKIQIGKFVRQAKRP